MNFVAGFLSATSGFEFHLNVGAAGVGDGVPQLLTD